MLPKSLDWVAQVTEHFALGGRAWPLNFMKMPRRLKFESFVHEKYDGATRGGAVRLGSREVHCALFSGVPTGKTRGCVQSIHSR